MVREIKSLKEFQEIIAEDKVTVVDFYATWCGPCKAISPFVEKLEGDFKDAVFVKVDVDEVSDVSAECGIRAMPTFQVFRKGQKIEEIVGANPNQLERAVTTSLAA
ncbi:Cytoplasmic thioredoxin isoenzyme 2 [Orbilia brochopaga]|uniref:Thioredoxin n=1 Tax=Orbilia brochopaga TaxID=3140254 RepID=A0AAV9U9R6_9PEZI